LLIKPSYRTSSFFCEMTTSPPVTAEMPLPAFTSRLEGPPVVVEHAALSDRGRRRSRNEDAFLADTPVFAIADGMGGTSSGHVASGLAIQQLASAPLPSLTRTGGLEHSIRAANDRIHADGETVRAHAGMGTTLTAVLVSDGTVRVAHVGDSRLYRIRDGQIHQLTRDHTYVEELVRRGRLSHSEARSHRWRSILTRAVGVEPDVDVDATLHAAARGDLYLLCSDGLTKMLGDAQIRDIVLTSATLHDAARTLVERANASGGRDNVTTVLFRLGARPGAARR
jgi:protein phosphatase